MRWAEGGCKLSLKVLQDLASTSIFKHLWNKRLGSKKKQVEKWSIGVGTAAGGAYGMA